MYLFQNGGLQKFVRELYSSKNSHGEEASLLWDYFKKLNQKTSNQELIFQILVTFSERYYNTSLEKLKKACIKCRISAWEMDSIIEEAKKLK